jgi:hypothetical protein
MKRTHEESESGKAAGTSAAADAAVAAAGDALTLVVGSGEAQARISVHRSTLMAASPVLHDLIAACPDALDGVPLPEDDPRGWALLAGLLQPLSPGLDAITHGDAEPALLLIDKYDMSSARTLVDRVLALRAPDLFATLPGLNSPNATNATNVQEFMLPRIAAVNLCHAHGLKEAEEAYTAQLLRQMRWESVLLKHALASTSGIESLALAKRLLQWLASGFR